MTLVVFVLIIDIHYYRPSTTCIHPDHNSAKVVNKSTSSKRGATYSQLSYLERRFPERQFVFGGQLRMKHIRLINNEIEDEKENANLNDSLVSEYEVQTHEVISFDEIEQSKETNNALSKILSRVLINKLKITALKIYLKIQNWH